MMSFAEYRRHGGILLWFLQRLSGLALLALLLGHFYLLHYYQEGFVTYDKVAARLAAPSWKAFDIAFLVMAVFHGMNGLWTVVIEYVAKEKYRTVCLICLILIGSVFSVIGGFSIALFTVKP